MLRHDEECLRSTSFLYMKTKEQVEEALEQYEDEYGDASVERIKAFVAATKQDNLYTRHNFSGHITASAFIFHPESNELLLIHHSTLQRWLQPGGHVEEDDTTLQAAALREAVEETGLSADCFTLFPGIIDIDSHTISANTGKQEPQHFHHDIRFLFTCNSAYAAHVQHEHVSGCRWINIHDLPEEQSLQRVAKKIAALDL